MKTIDISKQLPWKYSNGKMDLAKIKYLVIHHEGVEAPARYNTIDRIKRIANVHVADPKRFGGHIAYHYAMDNIGDIYKNYAENEVGYHAGNLPVNKTSIALVILGNYEKQKLNDRQIAQLERFIVWITQYRPDLKILFKPGVKMHKEVRIAPTACPGKNVVPYVVKFRK